MSAFADLWERVPALWQDAMIFAALLAPTPLIGAVVARGYAPFALVRALVVRFAFTNLLFVALIAVSVGVGVGLIAQERALRQGTARAADKFDLVVGAPGSEVTLMLAAVYLQPASMPLLSGALYAEIAANPNVSIAAPIAFGDSVDGAPLVGTIAPFVEHLAGAPHGRMFAAIDEAVAGARAPVNIGDTFEPAHGLGHAAAIGAHRGHVFTVVGRMPPTGTPWDRAVLIPVEAVWRVHGLPNGHGPGWDGTLGPPFDPAYFPGTEAIVVRAEQLWANYALRGAITRADAMAIFPGAVLARLHGLLGDVRAAMSALAAITQILVTAGVLVGLVILSRLFAQRLALLRVLGAPARFIFAVLWGYGASLIAAGALAGVGIGFVAAAALSRYVSARTELLVSARLGWPELQLIAGFVSLSVALAMLPAFAALARPAVTDLRG